MDKSDSNLRTTIDNRKICNEDVAFKSQKCHSAKSNNCNYISNTSLNVRVQDRKILTEEVVLKQENGAVIYGVVLFENGCPVQGATAVLSFINKNNKKITPISFMFTDENGVFIFRIDNTKCDYLINIVYN